MSKETVNTTLQLRSDAIRKGAEILVAKTRDWQTIKQYLCNRLSEDFLTEEQKEKLVRYQYIYNQLVSGRYTETEVVTQLTNPHIYGLGLTQAYDDLNATKEIFPSFVNLNKRFELIVQLQVNRDMLRKASEIGDLKSFAQIEKNRIGLLAQFEDTDETPGELFQGHTIEAVFDPSLLGIPRIEKAQMKELLDEINAKRKVKISTNFIEDINHEDVNP